MPYISKTALRNYFNKNPNTLRNSIRYWQKNNSLLRVKRGFYVYKSFLEKAENSLYYPRFLSGKMIEPSYLSMESVLQDYQLFSEAVYGYTAVTIQKTNSITNKFGIFSYRSIKADLFCGYSTVSYGDMRWYIASKAKALFDYIYFNQNKFSAISVEELLGLRLNLELMRKKDWQEYEKYLKKAPSKMGDIYKLIKKLYADR